MLNKANKLDIEFPIRVPNRNSTKIDLQSLVKEIKRLRLEMESKQDQDCGTCKALINIACAEREAKSGQTAEAIDYLKNAGQRPLDIARDLRLTMITEAVAGASEDQGILSALPG